MLRLKETSTQLDNRVNVCLNKFSFSFGAILISILSAWRFEIFVMLENVLVTGGIYTIFPYMNAVL